MRQINQGQKGAAGLEFAIIAALFLMIIFGIIEFGLIMYAKGIITNAGREGARFGVIYSSPRKTDPEIQAKVQDYLQGSGFTDPVVITVTGAGGSTEANLTVKVDYTYHFLILPSFVPGISNITLSAETVMRLE
ncbi:MAG: TadE/TadG family type IV pilus assembly protein [Desulfobaccales bacterium]|nr:TadE/TadG family type IV pilus assembly protein [Desulfobaccales bacterium]